MVIAVIAGTRPEIIKISPLIDEMTRRKIAFRFIHTGQHSDYDMFSRFIEELELPEPDITIDIEANSNPLRQVQQMVEGLRRAVVNLQPSLIISQGDTNSVLAAAITASKLGISLGHVEAGLRSNDPRMPEEYNRRIADQLSTLLFAPTRWSYSNLENENVLGKKFITGNTVIDAINKNVRLLNRKQIHIPFDMPQEPFILLTIHRAENVDDITFLTMVAESITKTESPIIFPVHPRTRKRFDENPKIYQLIRQSGKIKIVDPLGYLEFLHVMMNCKYIITDSGGIQEEITSPLISKKAIVLRKTTERPEAVKSGFCFLPRLNKRSIEAGIKLFDEDSKAPATSSPYGQGNAADKIMNILNRYGYAS